MIGIILQAISFHTDQRGGSLDVQASSESEKGMHENTAQNKRNI
jgi:hypothetical protein